MSYINVSYFYTQSLSNGRWGWEDWKIFLSTVWLFFFSGKISSVVKNVKAVSDVVIRRMSKSMRRDWRGPGRASLRKAWLETHGNQGKKIISCDHHEPSRYLFRNRNNATIQSYALLISKHFSKIRWGNEPATTHREKYRIKKRNQKIQCQNDELN